MLPCVTNHSCLEYVQYLWNNLDKNWFVQNVSLRLLACPSLMLQLHVTKRTMNKIMQKMWTLYYNQWSQHSSLVQTFDASKKLWEVILWDLPLLYPGRWVTPSMVPSSLSTLNSIYIIMYYIAYKKRWKYNYNTIQSFMFIGQKLWIFY